MAQTNYTPISLYYSATASSVPVNTNLVAGELAINTNDGKLFYKDSSGVVQVLATKGGVGSSSTTQVLYNSSGLVVGSSSLTFSGSILTSGGYTTGGNLTFTGTTNRIFGDFSNATDANRVIVQNSTTNSNTVWSTAPNGTGTIAGFNAYGGSSVANCAVGALYISSTATSLNSYKIGTGTTLPITFQINSSDIAQFDTSGNFSIGTIGSVWTGTEKFLVGGQSLFKSSGAPILSWNTTNAGTRFLVAFSTTVGTTRTDVGSITTDGSTTSYVTTSDYRLKENIAPMTGALEKIQALKPVTYVWKATGKTSQGFIAHELAEICPESVVGEKDAVDVDGNPQYQGIDTSFLIATLTAAIQELNTKVKALEAK